MHLLTYFMQHYADKQPQKMAFNFLHQDNTESVISYDQLFQNSTHIGTAILSHCKPGDRCLQIYPPGIELICAYFACLAAGVIAVPVYPPANLALVEKLKYIALDSEPALILCTQAIKNQFRYLGWFKFVDQYTHLSDWLGKRGQLLNELSEWGFEKIPVLATDKVSQTGTDPLLFQARENDIAFLQYTSGSTGAPKGVMVTHGNLAANIETMKIHSHFTPDCVGLVWFGCHPTMIWA
jgi:acyl-CoA synthetase (AMP-forming)/AMP-acid ligase II